MPKLRSDAVWTWFHDPRAVHHQGVTYVTWSSLDGIYIGTIVGGALTGEFRLRATSLIDDHNGAAVGIRSDGRLIAAYADHNDSSMRVRISTNPLDISSWGSEITAATGSITYPNLVYLSAEDRWYLFFRDFPDAKFVTSDDDGATWSSAVTLASSSPERPYIKVASDGVDQIHVLLTDKHPQNGQASIYHAHYDAGTWRDSTGASAGTPPLDFGDLTRIHDGTTVNSWIWDIALDGDGVPHIVYTTFPSDDDHRYHYGRLVAGVWQTHEITAGGGSIESTGTEPHYSAGAVLNHDDPRVVYACTPSGPNTWALRRFSTADGGQSWSTQTVRAAGKNMRPVAVRGGDEAVVWFAGRYDHYTSYAVDLWHAFVDLHTPPVAVPSATVRDLAPVVSGSHRMVVEARVLATFQVGDDPDGVEIPVLGGWVEMDGTADIQRRLTLVTDGSAFPRRLGDLLLPDGTEVWVRRGVDTGAGILWAPLGYFRVDDVEQPDAPDGPVTITGYDRTASLLDQQLIRPRQFAASRTYESVFGELVEDVYPGAQISFDDGLAAERIGRLLIVEQHRYEPLRTLAHGRGKIVHWDGGGVLRVRSAPDPATPLWEVTAGRDGVLTTVQRRVTRRDVVNMVVVRSQGGDSQIPARAVAVDDGPHSITRVGGRFGTVPLFITTPATMDTVTAGESAVATLQRRAGLPYQMQFGAVPNPALQPYDPVRVTLRDGSRERHVVEKLTVPLVAGEQMTASTREQRSSHVVVVST